MVNANDWLMAEDHGLKGDIEHEWNKFIIGLIHLGIRLTEQDDEIHWAWNKAFGQVNSKSSYHLHMFLLQESGGIIEFGN